MQIVKEYVSSTTGQVRSDGMLRLCIAQGMIFALIDGAEENMKTIVWAIENLSILSDWARPVVLGAHSWMNCIWNYFHDLQCVMVKNEYFEFFRYIFCYMENLRILFNRAHRVLLGTQEGRFKHMLGKSQNELLESAAVLTDVFQHVADDVTHFLSEHSIFFYKMNPFFFLHRSLRFYCWFLHKCLWVLPL